MRRILLIGIYLCIASLCAQMLAPAAAVAMDHAVDPLTIICGHTPGDAGGEPSDHRQHDHQHCLLCAGFVGSPTLDGRPAFAALDYPVASPLRWIVVDLSARADRQRGAAQPRGPPASF